MLERCQDYAPRIARDAAFSGPTAATLLGLPLPWRLQNLESLHIAVPLGRPIPRTEGILGRRLRKDLMQYWSVSGMPVLSPLAAFLTCCRDLTEAEGTTMLDAVVTTMAHYPGLKFQERPGAAIGDVRATFMTLNRFHGGRVARAALAECRERVASPKESETRLLLVQAGLPEPEVNGDVGVGSLHIAEVDLLYREAKVAIEYEGDHHRTDQSQWRKDLERERNLRALGYEYIRVTQQTLSESPRAFVAHVAALLARRTPTA
jgi:very-short-patch-repair endonuclease